MQFHTSIPNALKHPSTWIGLGGIIGTTSSQLPDPHRTHGLIIAGLFSGFGTLLKSPNDPDAPVDKDAE